ncbi:MAG: MBL fold metallo-hydrolase [Chitinophagales bacterium]|nr:MBL fold metallo-hydrolase [Chitinophagales bacterium]
MRIGKTIYHFDQVEYAKLSVYRLNKNVQTVYSFIVDDILIDTAQRHNRKNIYSWIKDKKINKIILTHHHEDHSGNVAFLMKKLGIDAFAHEKAVSILAKGYTISPLGILINGKVEKAKLKPIFPNHIIETTNYQLQAIYTPGHCDDHFCFYEANKGWLFSGDLYVADTIKYFASYENIYQQMDSLRKLCALDFEVLFCSHNPKTRNGKARLQNKLHIFEDFIGKVKQLYSEGKNTDQILKTLGRTENIFYKYITFGNFTATNLVKSVLEDA